MYVHVRTCTYICTYVCTCTYICTYLVREGVQVKVVDQRLILYGEQYRELQQAWKMYIYVHVCMYMYVLCMYMYVYVHVCMYMQVCIMYVLYMYMYVYAHVCMYMHVCTMYACVCTCTHVIIYVYVHVHTLYTTYHRGRFLMLNILFCKFNGSFNE